VTPGAQTVDGLTAIPPALRWLGGILFVLAVPLFIMLGNVLDVAGDRDFYQREFALYGVGRVTGLDDGQLRTVADAFITYLRDPTARLDVVVTIGGSPRPLFNQQEISHMEDVQGVFTLVRRLRLAAGAILLILPLVGLTIGGSGFMPRLGLLLTLGGIVTVVLLGLAGLLSLVDFTEAFVKFHEIFFSGGNWQFDPRTDYLVMLFPEGFWFDCVMRIAMLSAIEAVVLGGVGVALVFFGRRR
jgi:integral membrane protein (TIGR01906 family)